MKPIKPNKKWWLVAIGVAVAIYGLVLLISSFTTNKASDFYNLNPLLLKANEKEVSYYPDFLDILKNWDSAKGRTGYLLYDYGDNSLKFFVVEIGPENKRQLIVVYKAFLLDQSGKEEVLGIIKNKSGIEFSATSPKDDWSLADIFFWIILGGLAIFLLARYGKFNLPFLSSLSLTAKIKNLPDVTFADVAGIDEVKEELEEVVDFLKNPEKFTKLGARIPKGILLVGLPGTGKTLLARAVAGQAGVSFFSKGGSEFIEMYVGVGASRVRTLFADAKKHSPCIIFIDEIDAVGRLRGAGVGQTHDEAGQTIAELCTRMDGFEDTGGIVVMAATNRPDVLDPALLRPGRFDRQVEVPMPDTNGRKAILEVHTKNKPLADDVDLSEVARATPRFSGADLENLVNEAAISAVGKNKSRIDQEDFMFSRDKKIMGKERKIRVSDTERSICAFHESGHALIGVLVPGEPVHGVSIVPRLKGALGVTTFLPEEDNYFYTKEYCLATITSALGGRIAEEIIFGESRITTGAENDLKTATDLARHMICDWAMSGDLPLRSFGVRKDLVFLGKELGRDRDYGEELADKIDAAVQKIIDQCADNARQLLTEKTEILKRIAEALLEKETLTGDEIRAMVIW